MQTPTPHDVARAFVARIATFLENPSDLAEIDRRNAAESDPGICHSHDFCDPNEAMADAIVVLTGEEFSATLEGYTQLWAAAWALAKKEGFVKLAEMAPKHQWVYLDGRELATMLAALRCWQNFITEHPEGDQGPLDEIATDGDTLVPLNLDEMDTLCEKLNG